MEQHFTRTQAEQLLGDCELNDSGHNVVLEKTGDSTIDSGENLLNILGIQLKSLEGYTSGGLQ